MHKLKIISLFISAFVISSSLTGFIPIGEKVNAATVLSTIPIGARQMEYLDRGLITTKVKDGVYIGWRQLGTDNPNISFNIYREGIKINSKPITNSTNYLDSGADGSARYFIRPIVNGVELAATDYVKPSTTPYISISIKAPEGGTIPEAGTSPDANYTYDANDGSVADLDGDGQYEYIVKWNPTNAKDNSQSGYTGNVYIDAYKQDGTRLWRIDLGKNVRAGAHYTQFLAYDFNGDGKAEVAFRTSDGTVDGIGNVIGDKNADYRTDKGYILSGNEYLTIFNGQTGSIMSNIPFAPERGNVSDWGDSYGNRVDRFLAGVAYLDGVHPSIIMSRGYYVKTAISAYDFKNDKLVPRWNFVADKNQNSDYQGRGNHNFAVADVDNDNKDEIIFGSATIDDNGKGLYQTGLSHGDALHVGDLDPTRPGLEVFQVHEEKTCKYNADVRDAKTGEILWGVKVAQGDCGRGISADIDPRYPGEEVWAAKQVGLYSIKGEKIAVAAHEPSAMNFATWWDGDLSRELLDDTKIYKWDYENSKMNTIVDATGCASNNTTKATPVLQADILGDWREEVVWRTADNKELRIYSTTDVTDYRLDTLMHDPIYRLDVAWQNVGYNQPPHTSYFLGTGMKTPAKPNIYTPNNRVTSLTLADSIDITQGDNYTLPQNILATFNNGSKKPVSVIWDTINTSKLGQATVNGTIEDTNQTVVQNINIVASKNATQSNTDTKQYTNEDANSNNNETSTTNTNSNTKNNISQTSDSTPIIFITSVSILTLATCIVFATKKKLKNRTQK
ncbi:Ig-like domain-containing protein [Clostridium cibarium]|uniref:Ig-like domain-containing protein n=1 Tax=Clostridium cibarium TaxID=2762247 RepID=A0ABR8PP72_9CLOT|nr:Ig-like domain-containing protein [Clostridium cibarium]MBD7909960.1 Ig-like domain-containing protein [Clostridium cibarium]